MFDIRALKQDANSPLQTSPPGYSSSKTDNKRPSRLTRAHSNWWLDEILGAVASIVTFVIIIAILYSYDQSTIPHLPFRVSLNTVIATIATATKACLLLVAASAISQFKWLWVRDQRRGRRLQDLQIFDAASRGPLGAIKMLCSTRSSLAVIGAVIVILGLGFDPCIQGLVSYPSRVRSTDSSTAIVLRAENWKDVGESRCIFDIPTRGGLFPD